MVYITGATYAAIAIFIAASGWWMLLSMAFMALAFLLPNGGGREVATLVGLGVAVVVSVLVLIGVWKRSSAPDLSFFEGLEAIANRHMSGCMPLTSLYLYPLLVMVISIAQLYTVIGLFKGKSYTQERWVAVVNRFLGQRAAQ